jgi:DNA helicase II / ATP-dependent DNA helicase PcrA
MYNNQLHSKYSSIYTNLNSAQQQAVNNLHGAVMVIAGPGTGKTQILSARIGKILLETDASPENILCLTYTDAGVVAMRKRLTQFIGPDAYKVNIHTFHSFCNSIIQDNLHYFNKQNIDAVSDIEKITILKKLIDGFAKGNPLKRYRGDVYFEINNLSQLFASMKREGWTTDFLHNAIEQYCYNIKDDTTNKEFFYQKKYGSFNVGDAKASLQEQLTKMEKLKAAATAFTTYQEFLAAQKRYDFDDMINWVIDVFNKNANLLQIYQEQFTHILVDEYQDTSNTQNKIIDLLYNKNLSESIFVVGDDDQSIYRFQGANIENMMQFASQHQQQLSTVVLQNNYRSTQPILNVAQQLIAYNNERLVNSIPSLTKSLIASNTKINTLSNLPAIAICNNEHDELIFIAQQIQQLINQNTAPSSIAVIYKENKYGENLANYLRQLGINYYSKKHINLFNEPLSKQIITTLKYITTEHDVSFGGDALLFEILHFNWFGIKPIEIAELSVAAAKTQFQENKISLRQMLVAKAHAPAKDLFAATASPQLKQACIILEDLIAAVENETILNIFHKIVATTGLLKTIMNSESKHWNIQVIKGLVQFIEGELQRNPALTLPQLMNTIELMEKEGIPLQLVQTQGNDKGVNLLTAHGSKGLEFKHVFIAGCTAQSWEKKKKPSSGLKLPNTVFDSTSKTANSKEEEEELRRLFYVAITRAETNLIISYAENKNDGKKLEPSIFLAEIEAKETLPKIQVEIDSNTATTFSLLTYTNLAKPNIAALEDSFVQPIVDNFVMNVTALNNYLDCPLRFYFNNLVRIPTGKNEATEFGSAVHHALEMLFKNMLDDAAKNFPAKQQFISDFLWYMQRHRENFTKEQYDRRIEYGIEILGNYYDKYINQFAKIITPERRINNVVYNGVPLKGMIDKIEFDGYNVNVVDYKTGSYEKAKREKKEFDAPNDKNIIGGNYWRQAVFYKILIDNYPLKNWKVISTEFDFVEPNDKKEYQKEKIIINPNDLEIVGQQITTVYQKIKNKEFYTGCGKENCRYCNFVKNNELAIGFEEEKTED